ncbi:MAG: DUF4112 domain-containing protein [Opitutaceae bacterium]
MHEDPDIPTLDPYEDEWSDRIRRVENLANLFDSKFTIPGTNFKFGWDGLIGLIPGIGDTLTLIPQFYLVFEAFRLKIGWSVIFKMLLNVLIDWLIGLIPVLGDFFDIVFKSNLRNAKLMAEAMRQKRADV